VKVTLVGAWKRRRLLPETRGGHSSQALAQSRSERFSERFRSIPSA